ncbi:MAG TPA: methyltransferase domain-containing protein [Bacteriovoracaceae bacterium]|nr:methyltransferase domain-containing protein [Bacteriovoracaceae bacterium]
MNNIYSNYWERKKLLREKVPRRFEVIQYTNSESMEAIEDIFFQVLKESATVLDFGAGDMRIKNKMLKAGYKGKYETLDLSDGGNYTYRDLKEVTKKFDVILCLDVIEHLSLTDGLGLTESLVKLLNPTGALILQTPNARCVRNPLSWDMTHLHCYNAPDLWAYLTCMDLDVKGYRVHFTRPGFHPLTWIKNFISKIIITQFLGMDYADNIVMVARK